LKSPKIKHTAAVKRIGRYLLATVHKGIICHPNDDSITCYADASFTGEWDKTIAEHDPNAARSRSGFVVKYVNCPKIWSSKLQTEFDLSVTEAEYVALSQSLRPCPYNKFGASKLDVSNPKNMSWVGTLPLTRLIVPKPK
jgi:hypothetical protein